MLNKLQSETKTEPTNPRIFICIKMFAEGSAAELASFSRMASAFHGHSELCALSVLLSLDVHENATCPKSTVADSAAMNL